MFLRNRHNLWFRLFIVLAAMSLFVLGYQWGNQYQRRGSEPPRISGVLVRPPVKLMDLRLMDPFDQVIEWEDLTEDWALLAFGDLAQAEGQRAVQRLIDVYNRVADQGELRKGLRLLLIMTPDRPHLARDFARLSPALHLVRAAPPETAKLRDLTGQTGEDALTLFVLAPNAHLVALFPEFEDSASMATDLKSLVAAAPALLPATP